MNRLKEENLIKQPLQKAILVVTVMDHDKVGASETIGCVRFGLTTAGTELNHWTQMLSHPRKSIANWHALKEEEKK